MGLLKIIRKLKRKNREMRLLVLGLDNAGKTTLLKRLKGEDTAEVSPTLGFNIETLAHGPFQLTFWDVGGQKSLRAFWRNYFEETDGLVWVVDSADVSRAGESAAELARLCAAERLAGASLLVVASKRDLAGALPLEQLASVLGLGSLGRPGLRLAPADCRSGDGLSEALDWLVQDVAARIYV